MADDIRKLLDYIVRTYVVRDELVSIDLDASASDRGDSIESDKRRAARREIERADDLANAFSKGLARAYERHLARGDEIMLDDRNAEENQIADALIGFLVSHDLATSQTEETQPLHYRYHVAVHWDRLDAVARSAGIDLDQALRRSST